jgi:hypothetical protein
VVSAAGAPIVSLIRAEKNVVSVIRHESGREYRISAVPHVWLRLSQ